MPTELTRQFVNFDNNHPEVWVLFRRFTAELIQRGFQHHSSDAVLHRVRWETAAPIPQDDPDGYKINNNYSAYYARKFNATFPKRAGFFRLRASQADIP